MTNLPRKSPSSMVHALSDKQEEATLSSEFPRRSPCVPAHLLCFPVKFTSKLKSSVYSCIWENIAIVFLPTHHFLTSMLFISSFKKTFSKF